MRDRARPRGSLNRYLATSCRPRSSGDRRQQVVELDVSLDCRVVVVGAVEIGSRTTRVDGTVVSTTWRRSSRKVDLPRSRRCVAESPVPSLDASGRRDRVDTEGDRRVGRTHPHSSLAEGGYAVEKVSGATTQLSASSWCFGDGIVEITGDESPKATAVVVP
jgi:hypothetical protein